MQNPEGYTQIDGPEEATRESAWPGTKLRPRKRGYGRIFAAKAWLLATRFLAWPPLVRPSGYIILDFAYRLFILKIRDNLRSKLS